LEDNGNCFDAFLIGEDYIDEDYKERS